MSVNRILHNRKVAKILLEAASRGHLEDVIELSAECNNELLGEALIKSCVGGHLSIVEWLVEHTAVDVNYKGKYTTMAVTWKKQLHTTDSCLRERASGHCEISGVNLRS